MANNWPTQIQFFSDKGFVLFSGVNVTEEEYNEIKKTLLHKANKPTVNPDKVEVKMNIEEGHISNSETM